MKKISEFKIHKVNCAQSMAVLGDWIALAVYKDVVIFNTKVPTAFFISSNNIHRQ